MEIRKTLDAYMNNLQNQSASFLATIFSREHRLGGVIYEGHRPIAACQTDAARTYTLATSDSNYQLGCVVLNLSAIEYVETLRPQPNAKLRDAPQQPQQTLIMPKNPKPSPATVKARSLQRLVRPALAVVPLCVRQRNQPMTNKPACRAKTAEIEGQKT